MKRMQHPKPIADLLDEVRKVSRATRLSRSRISTLVLGGGREIERIERGGEIGVRKLSRVMTDLVRLKKSHGGAK